MFKSQEEKQRRFDREVKHLLESFKERSATIRVQFIGNEEVHMLGGKMFLPPVVSCKVNQLPKFITDKVAILKVHGERGHVDGVGKWLSPDSFYVDVTPNEWRDFYEKLSSS